MLIYNLSPEFRVFFVVVVVVGVCLSLMQLCAIDFYLSVSHRMNTSGQLIDFFFSHQKLKVNFNINNTS